MLYIADVGSDGGNVVRYNAIVVPVSWNVGLYNAVVALDGGIVAFNRGNVALGGGIFLFIWSIVTVIAVFYYKKGVKYYETGAGCEP